MANFILSHSYVADLPISYIKENDLNPLLFNYSIDGKKYYDDGFQSVSAEKFYEWIKQGKEPVTSQINANEYTALFKEFLDKGQDVLHLAFSSGISGSYNSGRLAVEELKDEYPDRKIAIIDSRCASLGYGLFIHYVNKFRNEGNTFEDTVAYAEDIKLKINHWFTVNDLYHLKRGGRVSGASAAIGTMLSIKPLLNMNDEGKLIAIDKIKGRKKALKSLIDKMEQKIVNPEGQDIFISHSACQEDAEYVAKLVKEKFPNIGEIMINYIGPVIGSHTGIGTIALFFMGDNRAV